MGGKHKKEGRKEKTKTKLKGAKLLKGLNITKTDFKVRKIVLQEQLKSADSSEALSSRNLNVKDCISRLQHHNSSFRTQALRNLKEIVANFPGEVVEKHLGDVVQNLSKLSLDIEREIRRESIKVLDAVLSVSSEDHIKPFFDILSSYTRCAMTHIHNSIQEDSLLLLDALIKNVPALVTSNRDKIFLSFLNMMSKLRNESKPDRTVTVNLGAKQTSVKWRIQILIRLNKMIDSLITQKISRESHDFELIRNAGDNRVDDAFITEQNGEHAKATPSSLNYFQINKPMFFPLIHSYANKNCSIPKLFNKTLKAANEETDEGTKIKNYAETLMPLLFESWLEVRPTILKNQQSTILTIDSAFTLKHILDIMEKLWTLTVMWKKEVNSSEIVEWFQQKYCNDFAVHLMEGFPYSLGDVRIAPSSSKKKKKDDVNQRDLQNAGGVDCHWQNLSASFMFCSLNSKIKGNDNKMHERILDFLTGLFAKWTTQQEELNTKLITVLQSIFLENGPKWHSLKQQITALLQHLIHSYESARLPKDTRTKILELICNTILRDNLMEYYGKAIFSDWIKKLPDMLLAPQISQHALQTFTSLAKFNNTIFLESLTAKACMIMQNLNAIEVTGIEDQFEGKKLIMNLFYWIPGDEIFGSVKQMNENAIQLYLHDVIVMRM